MNGALGKFRVPLVVGHHADGYLHSCRRKARNSGQVTEKIGGREGIRTPDPLVAKQIRGLIEIYGFLLILTATHG